MNVQGKLTDVPGPVREHPGHLSPVLHAPEGDGEGQRTGPTATV